MSHDYIRHICRSPDRSEPVAESASPPRPGWAVVAARLHRVADSLESGRRETPQRFIQLANFASGGGYQRRLLRTLVAHARDETEPASPALLGLLTAASRALASPEPDWQARFAAEFGPDIKAIVPYRRRRRHIHCHGRIAAEHRLLLLAELLDFCTPGVWFCGWAAIAYAVSDYAYDHFEMHGPAVAAARARQLAVAVEQELKLA